MIELAVICALILLNVFQFIFWARQVQRLVDKLMSRNYGEYQYGKVMEKDPPAPQQVPLGFDVDQHEDFRAIMG